MKLSQLKRKSFGETFSWIGATWFGSGCVPKAPGTMGSFMSLPLVLIGMLYGNVVFSLVVLFLFFAGIGMIHVVLKTQEKEDPGFVVIDETVGQSLALMLVVSPEMPWYYVLYGFALFRFFDIVKIWPASFFDRSVHNAFGVMMDDVVAGIYAAFVLYGISLL